MRGKYVNFVVSRNSLIIYINFYKSDIYQTMTFVFNKSMNPVLLFTIDWAYTYTIISTHFLYILVKQQKICNLKLFIVFIQSWTKYAILKIDLYFEMGIENNTLHLCKFPNMTNAIRNFHREAWNENRGPQSLIKR